MFLTGLSFLESNCLNLHELSSLGFHYQQIFSLQAVHYRHRLTVAVSSGALELSLLNHPDSDEIDFPIRPNTRFEAWQIKTVRLTRAGVHLRLSLQYDSLSQFSHSGSITTSSNLLRMQIILRRGPSPGCMTFSGPSIRSTPRHRTRWETSLSGIMAVTASIMGPLWMTEGPTRFARRFASCVMVSHVGFIRSIEVF